MHDERKVLYLRTVTYHVTMTRMYTRAWLTNDRPMHVRCRYHRPYGCGRFIICPRGGDSNRTDVLRVARAVSPQIEAQIPQFN
jgi:PAS domain-containing protein